jgi:anti-anti-sigma factor
MVDRILCLEGTPVSTVRIPRRGSEVHVVDVANNVAVVSLLGEHDAATADGLRKTLASLLQKRADVVIDLTETEFIDCSIVLVLDDTQRLAPQHDSRVSFQSATRPIVKRVFEVMRALDAWPVYETRADAIKAVNREPGPQSNLVRAPDGNVARAFFCMPASSRPSGDRKRRP